MEGTSRPWLHGVADYWLGPNIISKQEYILHSSRGSTWSRVSPIHDIYIFRRDENFICLSSYKSKSFASKKVRPKTPKIKKEIIFTIPRKGKFWVGKKINKRMNQLLKLRETSIWERRVLKIREVYETKDFFIVVVPILEPCYIESTYEISERGWWSHSLVQRWQLTYSAVVGD